MFFLPKIFSEIDTINKTTFSDILSARTAIKELVGNNLYLLIQKSILSGEYYEDDAELLLSKIDTSLNALQLKISSYLPAIQKEIDKARNTILANPSAYNSAILSRTEITKSLKQVKKLQNKYLEKYKDLVVSVKDNLQYFSTGREGIIADTKLLRSYTLKNELAETLESGISQFDMFNESLFELNILLAYMDDYLECNEDMLNELKSIKNYLKPALRNELNGEIFDLLNHKRSFLEYKIKFRNCPRQQKNHELPILLPEDNSFKGFQEKLHLHYSSITNAAVKKMENALSKYPNTLVETIILEPFHHLSRYYKKTNTDDKNYRKAQLVDLLKTVEATKGSNSENLFDQIAFKSINNLLQNSIIGLELLKEEENNYHNIIQEFKMFVVGSSVTAESSFINSQLKKLKALTEANYLPDYYCYQIFLEFLVKFITYLQANPSDILKSANTEPTESEIENRKTRSYKLIKYLQDIYDEDITGVNDNLRKMMTHEVKPVYLTYQECFVPYKWNDKIYGKLFIDSSYILPNNFDKIKAQIKSLENILPAKITSLKSSFEMTLSHMFIDNKKSEFEKKVKDNEIKLVQIIAMFVSIATFVLINVKIFDNKTGLESFGIIIGLAACFFIFNLFFYFIIMAQLKQGKETWRRVTKIAWFLLIPLSLWGLSFWILDREGAKVGAEIKSIKEKMKSDSFEVRAILNTKK